MIRLQTAITAGVLVAAATLLGFAASEAEAQSSVKVCGFGRGHGVGLSQYGAKGRAEAGQDYARIIRAYYKGVSLDKRSDNPPVRVLLSRKNLGGAQDVKVRNGRRARFKNLETGGTVRLDPGTYRVRYLKNRERYRVVDLSEGKRVGVYTGPLFFLPTSGGPLGYKDTDYRGGFLVRAVNSRSHLINQLPMERYIWGVVPNEMPASWEQAALRSQAVAARSYARATLRGKLFDFYPDSRDQIYGGFSSETRATNRAVRATDGVYATYNGRPITAFFHSSAGVYTEDSAYVFSDRPYLRAFKDQDRNGRPFEGRAYSNSPWIRWSGEIDPDGSPKLGIGSITDVRVLERSPSGRALKAEVRGTEGKKVLSGEYRIRYVLKHKGLQLADGSRAPAGTLPSARVLFGSKCS
jgi:SpoIID/LytB domain protein